MGGNIALMLGVKYQTSIMQFLISLVQKALLNSIKLKLIGSNHERYRFRKEIKAMGGIVRISVFNVPPHYQSTCSIPKFLQQSAMDMVAECGGTLIKCTGLPGNRNISRNISIPTMTVHGTADALVPIIAPGLSSAVAQQESRFCIVFTWCWR